MYPRRFTILLLLLCSLFLMGATGPAQFNRPQFVQGELLVKFKEDISTNQIMAFQGQFNTHIIQHFDFIDLFHLKLSQNISVEKTVQALDQHPLVEYAVPNQLYYLDATFPNDPDLPSLWGLHNTGQEGGTPDADIDAPEAWDITTGSPEVVVAVIDSGVDLDHEDLAANIWTNPAEIPANNLDDDHNGFIDDIHGWDFSDQDNDPSGTDPACRGHGTHVAGIIGAVGNNNLGVSGVNWNVKIMPLKTFRLILGSLCTTSTADVIAAIRYATMMKVRLSNNSWGGLLPDLAILEAIIASKSIFVAAAGNGFLDGIGDNNDTTPFFPASYPLNNIIAVAATDRNDQRTPFSNFGFTSVDLGAPGAAILSTLPENDYTSYSGTSMAAPHVAGVAALLLAQDPGLTNYEVKWRILNGTDNINLPVLSKGRLNAWRALQFGLSTPAVTVEATPLSPTTAPPLGLFSWQITATNHEANPIPLTFRVYLQFDFGLEVPLYQNSFSLNPNQTVNETVISQMPLIFPPGLKFRLFVQAETALSFDESWIAYTVGSPLFSVNTPHRLYLPLLQLEPGIKPRLSRQYLTQEHLYPYFFSSGKEQVEPPFSRTN